MNYRIEEKEAFRIVGIKKEFPLFLKGLIRNCIYVEQFR